MTSFDKNNFQMETMTGQGMTIRFRAYRNLSYVAAPADEKYQTMNIYVPEAYYHGQAVGMYTAASAPVFMPNTVGGYMPGLPEEPGVNRHTNKLNAVFEALARGYVVAAPGARGRGLTDGKGSYTGNAPACIVDLKAAVRYLRHISEDLPGDMEKIITNGTSAGGALSALMGATGNSADYEPYLKALGAADERDDIFAASCYCPITNLDHADMAYEWMYHNQHDFHRMIFQMTDEGPERRAYDGMMTEEQIEDSREVRKLFPGYLNGLELKGGDGRRLSLDENGEGSFKEYVKSFVTASARKAAENGEDLTGEEYSWISWKEGVPCDIDFDRYTAYAGRMKAALAFDSMEMNTPENELFGNEKIQYRHFSEYSAMKDVSENTLAESLIIKMMNPMNYIDNEKARTAQFWRIRHGAVDRDTSLAVPVILAAKLREQGCDVDFALPWGYGHAGDYDLEELFLWVDRICG